MNTSTRQIHFLASLVTIFGLTGFGAAFAEKPSETPPAPASAAPAKSAAPAPVVVTPTPGKRLPGRVIMGEIIAYDQKAKTLQVKNLKGEIIDLAIGPKTQLNEKETLAVGAMVRTRFDEQDGKNVPFFVRIMPQNRAEEARRATTAEGTAAAAPAETKSTPPPAPKK